MDELELRVDASGIEGALRALDPKNVDRALILWFDRGLRYVRGELQGRAPSRLRGKIRSMTDGRTPPRWARVYVRSPLAHLIEGGTGRLGAGGFSHRAEFFPAVDGQFGIMASTGLPRPQAFLVARAIAEAGGTRPRPFIRPTFGVVEGPLVRLAEQAAAEAMG